MTTSALEIGIGLYLCIGIIIGYCAISSKSCAKMNIVSLLAIFVTNITYWPLYLVGTAIERMKGEP